MDAPKPLDSRDLDAISARRVNEICERFEIAARQGGTPRIEDYLNDLPEPARSTLLVELIALDRELRAACGVAPSFDDYLVRFPANAREISMASRESDRNLETPDAIGDDISIAQTGTGDFPTAVRTNETRDSAPANNADVATVVSSSPPITESATVGAGATSGGAAPRVRYFGDYELESELARGGMGVVYKARQTNLNRVVALKMILAGQLASEADIKRFYFEAEAAANLDHSGIVPIYEVGEHEGQHYFSMGFVEGQSLARKASAGPLPPREAAALVREVSEAIQYAHEHGVIHRDLKPANVLLDAKGRPKITDFGLAKKLERDSGLTASGQVMGTPSYMPPEQASGKLDIGPRADVYSLGAVLYHLLTGRPPFQAATALDTLLQVLEQDPVSPTQLNPELPRDLDTICLKCLEKVPNRRYDSARALGDEVGRWLDGKPILARPISSVERAVKWARRRPAIAASMILVVVVTAMCFGLVTAQWRVAVHQKALANARAVAEAKAKREAREQTELAQKQLFRAETALHGSQIGQAQSAIQASDLELARTLLDRSPADKRSWEHRFLDGALRREMRTISYQSAWVRGIAYSPDGRQLASASIKMDQTLGDVRIHDVDSGRETLAFEAHVGGVWALAFSPDGARLATAGEDKTVKVWNARDGRMLLSYDGHAAAVDAVSFSPDGARIASVGEDGTARIWDSRTAVDVVKIEHPSARAVVRSKTNVMKLACGVAFRPDGKLLACATGDAAVRIHDAASGALARTLNGHGARVEGVAFDHDGKRLASAASDGTVRIWRVDSGEELLAIEGAAQNRSVDFSQDGQRLVSACGDGTIRIWDSRSGTELNILRTNEFLVQNAVFSTDAGHVAFGAMTTARIWTTTKPPAARALDGYVGRYMAAISIRPDGRRIAAAGDAPEIVEWDTADWTVARRLKGHAGAIAQVLYSPDGRLIASLGRQDGTVRLWDAQSGDALRLCRGGIKRGGRIAFRADGRRLAGIEGGQPTITVWDTDTGEVAHTLTQKLGRYVFQIAYSPDGRWLVSSGNDYAVTLWDAKSGREVGRLAKTDGPVSALAFHPDSRHLLIQDFKILIVDVAESRTVRVFEDHADKSRIVGYTPDGRRFISLGATGAVSLGDAETGIEMFKLRAHDGSLFAAEISADGRYIVTTGQDGAIKVWDAPPTPPDTRPLIELIVQ